MLFVTRTPEAFWKWPFPAPTLFWAIVGTQIFAVLMCAFAWGLTSLSWSLIGLVWV
jgi:H+-transporting ATPase